MKVRLMALTLMVALMGLLLAPMSAGAEEETTTANPFVNIPVTGTAEDGSAFSGLLTITSFEVDHAGKSDRSAEKLVAVGTLTGTLNGQDVSAQEVRLPVKARGIQDNDSDAEDAQLTAMASCTILTLVLGPLDLNLLGLMVHLDKVVLTITAQQGPGNLLGNLLCAIANLLNPNTSLSALAGLLNALIPLLGRL